MKHNFIKIGFALVLLAVMSGCASQPGKISDSVNPFCTLAGAAVGGGGAAAITLAAGPIGAGMFVGALLGTLACSEDPAPPPVAAAPAPAAPAPVPAPEPDSDGDGVIDRLDRCPDTPRSQAVDQWGCPDILLTMTGVNFKFDRSDILPESETILNQGVDSLKKAGAVDVRVVGHTDSVGSDAYNQKLSERRANSVRDYLISLGISGSRLTTDGKGESQPVDTNNTDEGRYQNRRVEFHVVGSGRMAPAALPQSNSSGADWRRLDQTVIYYGR